ncbi:MAG: FAD-dependent oxidoreductase [Limnohabitans sp.]|nr:FAD-dependent oxidoreductase [Limnohabitans sp.]
MTESKTIAIAGGGIGGLSAALALGIHDIPTHVYEQAEAFKEAGAGIGLGPNAMRVLNRWGLGQELREVGCAPDYLLARNARDARILGRLPMGQAFIEKYGASYLTIHRSDLHTILQQAVKKQSKTQFYLKHRLESVNLLAEGLDLKFKDSLEQHQAQVLVGADGLNSLVRSSIFSTDKPRSSGHCAYRALITLRDLPKGVDQDFIGIWMGSRLHVVHYPVRGGNYLNLVVLIESHEQQAQAGWDLVPSADKINADLKFALQACCNELQELIRRVEDWRCWCLFDRDPLQHASQMAQGRVALLGDAAHPMLPYLAQGAGMAIEDAACLAQHWQQSTLPAAQRLLNYANARWQRVSRVQQRARRNGSIYHAQGVMRMARDAALKLGGSQLMDMPWLYAG